MELRLGNTLLPGDPRLIDHIVGEVKSQGIFDQFRKDALADVDTKPAYQNLRTRVEGSVNSFLSKQVWKPDLNKNQLRETLRKHISDGAYLDAGVERIVDQVVNPKIYSVFMPHIEDIVYKYLGIEKPKREKNSACGIKDLLPVDLDPVSPESDKNSLKDVSLDSVDADILSADANKEKLEELEEAVNQSTNHENENNDEVNIINYNCEVVEQKSMTEDESKVRSTTPPIDSNLLIDSAKSDDKTEEEEEDSPVFEPIDIMNFNESNVSNDSHLSGISELTSHRSRSPDFGNEFSQDNFDFSNQDSQFSKVSSDSRLSIVTDFGSSNPASTPISDIPKEDSSRDKLSKDNVIKTPNDDTEKYKEKEKDVKICDINKQKDNVVDSKDGFDSKSQKSNSSSREVSRDTTDSGSSSKDRSDPKDKEKSRSSSRSKSSKENSDTRESRSHREKSHKRKSSSSDNKNDNLDKSKIGEKESSRDSNEKLKEKEKEPVSKNKDEKSKETTSKEPKDLKDIYKEKIRELREKKELTEKEKLNKDIKDSKLVKDSKDKKSSSSKDKKDDRGSSSKSHNSSNRHESKSKSSSRDDSKSSSSSSRDKSKKDEHHHSKGSKNRSGSSQSESTDKKRSSKVEKDEKSEKKSDSKSNQKSSKDSRKESRSDSHSSRSSEKSESKRDSESKDKKRREEKKSKTKDDHCSVKKSANDRRSSDRDGSNGSNSKGGKSSSSPSSSSSKPTSSSLNKESSNASNSGSETSDGVNESQAEGNHHVNNIAQENRKTTVTEVGEIYAENEGNLKRLDLGQNEISLPLKKRPLQADTDDTAEYFLKKLKVFHTEDIKKSISVVEKPVLLKSKESREKRIEANENVSLLSQNNEKIISNVPDDERVQIIEVKDEEDDEPYPEDMQNYTKLDQPSSVILEDDTIINPDFIKQCSSKTKLSEMELSIRQSLNEMMSDSKLGIEMNKTDPENNLDSEIGADKSKEGIESNAYNTKVKKESTEVSKNIVSVNVNKLSDDEEDCLYFLPDNERLNRFYRFLQSIEQEENITDEEIKKIMNAGSKSSGSKQMAPPVSKRKYSSSPLSDTVSNNSDNNNESTHTNKLHATTSDEEGSSRKKKVGRPKKQKPNVSSCGPQCVTNGEHFIMPLSPDSDVSATSEKMSLNNLKDDKSRQRNSQRYTSDDLYKPRPLFVGSSRRSRRSDQA